MVKPLAMLMAIGELQPFFPPDPLKLLLVDAPALYPQELPDLPIAIPAIMLGQSDQGQAQIVLVLLPDLITQGCINPENFCSGMCFEED